MTETVRLINITFVAVIKWLHGDALVYINL